MTFYKKSTKVYKVALYTKCPIYMCMSLLQGCSKDGHVIQCSSAQWLSTVGHGGRAWQRSSSKHGVCCLPQEGCCHCKEVSLLRVQCICLFSLDPSHTLRKTQFLHTHEAIFSRCLFCGDVYCHRDFNNRCCYLKEKWSTVCFSVAFTSQGKMNVFRWKEKKREEKEALCLVMRRLYPFSYNRHFSLRR